MPGYVAKAVHKFQHPQPKQAQHALHECTIEAHDPKVKCTQEKPDLPYLDPSGTQQVQSIAGTLI